MPPAARTGDETSHAGTITVAPPTSAVAVESVLIGGQPAAVVGSLHVCPLHAELGPANVIIPSPGTTTAGVVLIGGLPAARVGDRTACQANVITGALTVLIGGAA
jgi:uncharacterized Zn-binding protein involved in type VI secretion